VDHLRPIQKCRSCHLLAGLPEIRFGSAASPRAASPVHRGRWQEITDGKKNINNVHITYNLSCTETCTGRFDLIYVSYVLHTILFCLLHRAKRRGSGGATTTDSDRGCTAPVWPRLIPSGQRSTGGCKLREHDYETKPNPAVALGDTGTSRSGARSAGCSHPGGRSAGAGVRAAWREGSALQGSPGVRAWIMRWPYYCSGQWCAPAWPSLPSPARSRANVLRRGPSASPNRPSRRCRKQQQGRPGMSLGRGPSGLPLTEGANGTSD
jgi:hypothetical protein